MDQRRLKAGLLVAALALLVVIPWVARGSDEGSRLVAQAILPYAIFSLIVLGASVVAWTGPRWIAASLGVVLLVGGFLYFFFLPAIVIPPLLVIAASFVKKRGPNRTREGSPRHG